MSFPPHDVLVQMFRDRPQFAVEILHDLMEVELPATPLVRVKPNTFSTRPFDDFEADLVIVMGPPQTPAHAIIVEVQQDKSKNPRQLARHAAALWLMLGCDVSALVVCPDREVAAHYTQPIDSGLTGYHLHACVLGGELMKSTTWPIYSPFAREHYGRGFTRGYANGLAEAGAEPMDEQEERERREQAAKSVLTVLTARNFDIPDDTRARITACTDLTQLRCWVSLAATTQTVESLFYEPNH